MRIAGKRIFLDNHTIENLDKMYLWCTDREIIELEMGEVGRYKNVEEFKNEAMAKFIACNHEANSTFCHFGVYRADNGELVGSVDFFDIGEDDAELSVMIADKKYRHKHYGMDAFFAALEYGFKTRKWAAIRICTRIDNHNVKNICAKLGLDYEVEHFSDDSYDIDLIKYRMSRDLYDKVVGRFFPGGSSAPRHPATQT